MKHAQEMTGWVLETSLWQWAILWNTHEYLLWNPVKTSFFSSLYVTHPYTGMELFRKTMPQRRERPLSFTEVWKNWPFSRPGKVYFLRNGGWSRHVIEFSSHLHLSYIACGLFSNIRIREIKKYYFKPCSAHLQVCSQAFLMSDDQESITFSHFISPLVNDTSLALLSFLLIWWVFARIWRNSFSSFFSLLLNFKIYFTCKYLIIYILWTNGQCHVPTCLVTGE